MGFRKMRCRHGLRREEMFVLLLALAEAAEEDPDSLPSLDLSMLIEYRALRSTPARAARPSTAESSETVVHVAP